MAKLKDEMAVDEKMDDLVNDIGDFYNEDTGAKRTVAALQTFVDSKIFATNAGRESLIERIELSLDTETTAFEEDVLEKLETLASNSFVLDGTDVTVDLKHRKRARRV